MTTKTAILLIAISALGPTRECEGQTTAYSTDALAANFSATFNYIREPLSTLLSDSEKVRLANTRIQATPGEEDCENLAQARHDGQYIVTICSRGFRYFYEFIIGMAYKDIYLTFRPETSLKRAIDYTQAYWKYLSTYHAAGGEPQCDAPLRLYMWHKNISGSCDSDVERLKAEATNWLYADDGLIPENTAKEIYASTNRRLTASQRHIDIRDFVGRYVKLAFVYIILHEVSHILNGDLEDPKQGMEMKADQRALSLASRLLADDLFAVSTVFYYGEVYWQPHNEGSAMSPPDERRIAYALIRTMRETLTAIDTLPSNKRKLVEPSASKLRKALKEAEDRFARRFPSGGASR